jgi:prolipoprotein diacylglyceryltransferase
VEHGRNTLMRGYGGTLKSVSFEATDEFVRTDSITYPVLNTTLSFARLNDVQTEQYTTDFLPRILNMQNSDNQNLLVQGVPEVTVYEDENGWHAQTQVLGVPRYPTQLFEAAGYWLFFIILVLLYLKTSVGEKRGFLFGLFLVLVFGFRFFIENFKEVQVDFEQGMQLNMGQWLSIPLVAIGLLFIALSKRNKSSL